MHARALLRKRLRAGLLDGVVDGVPDDDSLQERATESAERLARVTGEGRGEVVALLKAMTEDREHPILGPLQAASMQEWTMEDDSWSLFQRLVTAVAEGIEAIA
jgi:hypothetical protein